MRVGQGDGMEDLKILITWITTRLHPRPVGQDAERWENVLAVSNQSN